MIALRERACVVAGLSVGRRGKYEVKIPIGERTAGTHVGRVNDDYERLLLRRRDRLSRGSLTRSGHPGSKLSETFGSDRTA
jgi:hypothetical protein